MAMSIYVSVGWKMDFANIVRRIFKREKMKAAKWREKIK